MALYRNAVGFSAHKNSVDQTGVVPSTFTLVTFPTEVYDVGNYYDAPSGVWTPPAGLIDISAYVSILATNVTVGIQLLLSVYKNGARYKDGNVIASTVDNVATAINIKDQALGTDTYDIRVFVGGTGNKTVWGLPMTSYFMGSVR